LARDLAGLLGTVASVVGLRRTRIGTFGLDDAVSLESLMEGERRPDGFVLPIAGALRHLPYVGIEDRGVKGLRSGRPLRMEDLRESDLGFEAEYAVLVDYRGEAVGIARRVDDSGGSLAIERVL
jgi:tRNA pseudouridine55 synthase